MTNVSKIWVTAAAAVGVALGSYGVASAASGSGSSRSAGSTAASLAASAAPQVQAPWGPQRSDETPLTGNALSKVTAMAKEKVPGGTVVRVETDADGHAAYEAHMVRSDGTPVTVYVAKNFDFVSLESR